VPHYLTAHEQQATVVLDYSRDQFLTRADHKDYTHTQREKRDPSSFQGYGTTSEIQGSATEALGLLGIGDSTSSLVYSLILYCCISPLGAAYV